MRLKAKVDDNQKDIVTELRKRGYSVAHIHQIGKGFPDIIVGKDNMNYLFEIKDCSKPPSQRKLTPDEVIWHSTWTGQVHTVCTAEDIIRIITN